MFSAGRMRDKFKAATEGAVGAVDSVVEEVCDVLPPVPGLKWLLGRIVRGVDALVQRFTDEDDASRRKDELGYVLTGVVKRGRDIDLTGPMYFVSLFSYGVSAAAEREARDRGIKLMGLPAG